jgi:hypothetical protein
MLIAAQPSKDRISFSYLGCNLFADRLSKDNLKIQLVPCIWIVLMMVVLMARKRISMMDKQLFGKCVLQMMAKYFDGCRAK